MCGKLADPAALGVGVSWRAYLGDGFTIMFSFPTQHDEAYSFGWNTSCTVGDDVDNIDQG